MKKNPGSYAGARQVLGGILRKRLTAACDNGMT